MLDAEDEIYGMYVIPVAVQAFVEENEGAWPRSWEDLQAGPQPVIFVGQHSIDYERVRPKIFIDFDADPSEVARQSPSSFMAIRPIDPVYQYPDEPNILQLIGILKRYHADGP
jgi:hypothetical protein